MNTIHTLTVNGQGYALPDPKTVLDDSTVSPDTTWSSRKIAAVEEAASIVCGASGKVLSLPDASNRALPGLILYGKTTQNGTPTPENPVPLESLGAGGALTVSASGRNLLPYPYVNTTKTVSGITFTDNGDGSVTVKGTAAAQVFFNIFGTKSGLYLIGRVTTKNAQSTPIYLPHSNITIRDVTVQQSETGSLAYIYVDKGVTVDKTYYPRIELGDTSADTTQWEPYKPVQTLAASTPNGLPGIPVPSVGNYTDENGQAWICDEVDFARGVYVQRISTVDMGNLTYNYNTDGLRFITTIGTMKYDGEIDYPVLSTCYRSQYNKGYGVSEDYAISTYYLYGRWIGIGDPRTTDSAELKELLTGETLMYIRQTPIETALSAEELAAYAALHTNKPNTTIYNDASAHMQLRYIADTKTYIDRRLAALVQEVTA